MHSYLTYCSWRQLRQQRVLVVLNFCFLGVHYNHNSSTEQVEDYHLLTLIHRRLSFR
jgi:hypothetical protein